MHRSEVSTPQLEAALTALEESLARTRRQRRNLLKFGHIIHELETNPDLWVNVRIRTPSMTDRPEVFATIHQPFDAPAVADLIAYLRLELGEPLEENHLPTGSSLLFWSSRAIGCAFTLTTTLED